MDKNMGIVISVDSSIAEVAMHDMVNDSNILWDGKLLPGPKVGSFVSIHQGNVRIIAKIISERVIDQNNSIRSKEFDDQYSKNPINRVIVVKSIGAVWDDRFQITSRYVPRVGDSVFCISYADYSAMYALGENVPSLHIGKDLLGGREVDISINRIFASHIGIFGNTGSGKSNTLHRLYLNLFNSKYGKIALENSKFIVIDFNGEYSHHDSFGVPSRYKNVYRLSTRSNKSDKIPVSDEYIFDPEILAMLFDANPATQVPFINSTLKSYNEKQGDWDGYARFIIGTLLNLLITRDTSRGDALSEWINLYKKFIGVEKCFLDSIESAGTSNYRVHGTQIYFNHGDSIELYREYIYNAIRSDLFEALSNSDPIRRIRYIIKFSYIHSTAWGQAQKEHLDPLMKRMDTVLSDLDKIIEVRNGRLQDTCGLFIVDLLHVNRSIKRMISMLFAKMMYGEQKNRKDGMSTSHLIIDEAHNILNANSGELGDHWKDYRLDVFEEIIKEGRKFGFYLTLSSQRPADISPTIISQIHNYFIHRLVNELDLRMIERFITTLDRLSFDMIPKLGKGECIIIGADFSLPVFTVINWVESDPGPHINDVVLTELWIRAEREAALKKAEFYNHNLHISKQCMYNLLTGDSENFTPEGAQYAVENMKADWNANALEKAKSYQKTMNMSPEAIRSHLTSSFEGFTEEEADYAVTHLS